MWAGHFAVGGLVWGFFCAFWLVFFGLFGVLFSPHCHCTSANLIGYNVCVYSLSRFYYTVAFLLNTYLISYNRGCSLRPLRMVVEHDFVPAVGVFLMIYLLYFMYPEECWIMVKNIVC